MKPRRRSVGAASVLPPMLRRAVANASGKPGSLSQIEHVVVLMQENRSFDHYFGSLPGVRGFGDTDVLTMPGGPPAEHQRVAPPDVRRPDPDAECPPGRPASFPALPPTRDYLLSQYVTSQDQPAPVIPADQTLPTQPPGHRRPTS